MIFVHVTRYTDPNTYDYYIYPDSISSFYVRYNKRNEKRYALRVGDQTIEVNEDDFQKVAKAADFTII